MMGAVAKINFDDMTDAIPAFLTILVMPLAYSISEGIAIGIISWTLINVLTGKAKEKKITPLMYVLTVLFILKYIFLKAGTKKSRVVFELHPICWTVWYTV